MKRRDNFFSSSSLCGLSYGNHRNEIIQFFFLRFDVKLMHAKNIAKTITTIGRRRKKLIHSKCYYTELYKLYATTVNELLHYSIQFNHHWQVTAN